MTGSLDAQNRLVFDAEANDNVQIGFNKDLTIAIGLVNKDGIAVPGSNLFYELHGPLDLKDSTRPYEWNTPSHKNKDRSTPENSSSSKAKALNI